MQLLELHDENGCPFAIPVERIFRLSKNGNTNQTIINVDTGSKQIFYIAKEPYETVVAKLKGLTTRNT